MNIVHVKLTFEDTFSFCKLEKVCTRSERTFEDMKKEIGKIVHRQTTNGVTYLWKLISVEQL